jgi:hypothetical protein
VVSTAGESSQSKFGNSEWDTEGIATVLHAKNAFRMLTKARRELAFGRKGHCKSPSTAAFSTSCSLIVPSNNLLRDETEFNATGVGRGRRVSRVLYPLRDGDHLSATPVARRL